MVADAGDDFKRGELLHIRRRKTRDVLGIRVLIFASMNVEGSPFRKPAAEDFAGFLDLRLARGLAGDCAVMAGHLFAGVLGDAKNEKAKIHEHRMDGLAG